MLTNQFLKYGVANPEFHAMSLQLKIFFDFQAFLMFAKFWRHTFVHGTSSGNEYKRVPYMNLAVLLMWAVIARKETKNYCICFTVP